MGVLRKGSKKVEMFQDLVSLTAQYSIDEASFSKAYSPKHPTPSLLLISLFLSLSLSLSLFVYSEKLISCNACPLRWSMSIFQSQPCVYEMGN